jgi:hypothetical protein
MFCGDVKNISNVNINNCLKNCEFLQKVQRPAGAGVFIPSGSSYWLAALPPCGSFAILKLISQFL